VTQELPSVARISDPVHGYVTVSPVERLVLDDPVAQRLRYITQNGLAQLVYPSLVTSRFSHSLGTMHLASSFLAAVLRNSPAGPRNRFLDGMRQWINARAGRITTANAMDDWATAVRSPALLTADIVEADSRAACILSEQALRLAALFHDLGHLPFSHDFEFALEEYWRDLSKSARKVSPLRRLFPNREPEMASHERLGHALSLLLLRRVIDQRSERDTSAIRLVFELAQDILDWGTAPLSELPSQSLDAVECLHVLIDGEIDADRCDYILRDGRSFGFDFASYDLVRLQNHLVIFDTQGKRPGIPRLDVAVLAQGVSAAESFLLARYRSYQHGARHHKVAQVGAALKFVIVSLLKQARPGTALHGFIDDIGKVLDRTSLVGNAESQLLDRFARYDDLWLMGVMREAQQNSPDDPWLALVCQRRSGPRSLWKRRSDFPDGPLKRWNRDLFRLRDPDVSLRWSRTVAKLREVGVLVVRHQFKPWAKGLDKKDRLRVLGKSGFEEGISEFSPLVRAMDGAWQEEVQVQAFATPTSRIKAKTVCNRLKSTLR